MLRQDITGLRAIAVLAVTFFHISIINFIEEPFLSGGFLGVDIFFVISGFLMTKIIMTGLDNNNFSLWAFYKKRAKRICPALIVVACFTILCGFFLLSKEAFTNTAIEAKNAILFISNIKYASNTDYFANTALDHPLLHTWSLSVEWQFYMFYPVLLMLIKRFIGSKHIPIILLNFMIASFIFAIYLTRVDTQNSYYLLPTRAFELLVGAMAFFFPLVVIKEACTRKNIVFVTRVLTFSPKIYEAIGLLIIVLSLFLVNDYNGWPNYTAIFPLFGTYFCIAANNKDSLLKNALFQKLGLWSYALYIVHWPILFFVNVLNLNDLYIPVASFIFIFGILLHYSVERRRNFGFVFLGIYICSIALFQWLRLADINEIRGFSINPEIAEYAEYGGSKFDYDGKPKYFGNGAKKPDFLLIGDSFSRQYTNSIYTRDINTIAVFANACIAFDDMRSYFVESDEKHYQSCKIVYDNIEKVIQDHPDIPVIWAQCWEYHDNVIDLKTGDRIPKDQLSERIIRDIKKRIERYPNTKFFIVGTAREDKGQLAKKLFVLSSYKNPINTALFNLISKVDSIVLPPRVLSKKIAKAVKDYPNVTFIDPNQWLCDQNANCKLFVKNTYIPIFADGYHFSWAASDLVLTKILDIVGVDQGKPDLRLEKILKENK